MLNAFLLMYTDYFWLQIPLQYQISNGNVMIQKCQRRSTFQFEHWVVSKNVLHFSQLICGKQILIRNVCPSLIIIPWIVRWILPKYTGCDIKNKKINTVCEHIIHIDWLYGSIHTHYITNDSQKKSYQTKQLWNFSV